AYSSARSSYSLRYPRHSSTLPHFSSLFFFSSSGPHPHLHSFPTRRSSDLRLHRIEAVGCQDMSDVVAERALAADHHADGADQGRSEEHTSELQSRSDLVCRLLLEKKKKKKTKIVHVTIVRV